MKTVCWIKVREDAAILLDRERQELSRGALMICSGDACHVFSPPVRAGVIKGSNSFRHKYEINVQNNYIVPSIASIQYQS